ncbi:hypothetical protein ACFOMD_16740 [Sphingoaurantiacus capsulatus]|uniref:Uncharacterized protein n=1 Tax=Sphingoaurantiacus capsulatus TaxID=1771310 RepID=A0ABV7XGN6_9SPHN
MTEAERCRNLADTDRKMAAETNLEMVRVRHLQSADVWDARADLFERTGLKSVSEDA